MSTNLTESKEETVGAVCMQPQFTERVNQYVDDPLNSPEAEMVEDHLLDCRACREFVDTIFSIRGEATRNARGKVQSRISRIATHRKERLQRQ